jgi:predicted DNA-binding protein
MSATRTQVYFSDEQRRRIDAAAAAQGVTLAEIVRRAVDAYLRPEVDASAALDATFGVDPGATVPSRDEWDRG